VIENINEHSATTGLPKPVALGQSVNSNVALVVLVIGHPCTSRLSYILNIILLTTAAVIVTVQP
jgi:hypothetical protein